MLVSFSSQGPLQHQWHAVALSEDVTDEPVAVELLREQLVLWRGPSGTVIAAPDRCTHRKADLSLGTIKDGCLTCPLHGWTFGEGGRCVHIPLREVIDESTHLTTFGCEERHGLVWVCRGTPRSGIPTVAADDDTAFDRISASATTWAAPAARIVEALLGLEGGDGGEAAFDVPFTYRRTIAGEDGSPAHLLVTCSPVGAATSRVFPVLWTTAAATADDLLEAELAAVTALKPTVEAVPGMFEIDEGALDGGADPAARWRRALLDAASPKA